MGYFADIFAVVTFALTAAWLLSVFVFTQRSSRDLIWRTALVVVALAPGLPLAHSAAFPWQWPLAILPAASLQITQTRARGAAAQSVAPASITGRRRMIDQERAASSRFSSHDASFEGSAEISAVPSYEFANHEPTAGALAREGVANAAPGRDHRLWPIAVAAIWLFGTLLQGVRIALALWKVRWQSRFSVPARESTLLALNAWAATRVGLRRPVAMFIDSRFGVPVVTGLLRPRVTVPANLATPDTRRELRAALLHEYGHVRRSDLAFDFLRKIVVGVFWPHPLVHLMAREIRQLREEICDNYVLVEESPVAYAEMLLRLSVGLRLSERGLFGLWMFSGKNRLETRIESLLIPGRSADIRPRPALRRLVIASTAVALMTALVIRLERATVAAPVEAFAGAAGDSSSALSSRPAAPKSAGVTAAPAVANPTKAGARPGKPREFRFRIVTTAGAPVEGATVTPWAVMMFGGGIGFDEKQVALAKSDADGIAIIVFTPEVEKVTSAMLGQFGLSGVQQIALKIDHPLHPVVSKYFPFGADQPIVLPDSVTVRVRAHRASESGPAKKLFPVVTPVAAADWAEADGLVTLRRVDVAGESGSRWLRIAQAVPSGPFWFSDLVDLKHLAGNPIDLDVALNPGIQIQGELGKMVPRPVKNGRLIAYAADASSGGRKSMWSATAEIAADGTFALESLPPSTRHLQVVALCDGWISRSPTQAELKAYSRIHGFTAADESAPGTGVVLAQWHSLPGDVARPIIPMDPTASCEVTVLDPQGKPIADAGVQFFANQVIHGVGATHIGVGFDLAASIRDRLAAGNRGAAPQPSPACHAGTVSTNAQGIALVAGLPTSAGETEADRMIAFVVQREGYEAVSDNPSARLSKLPVPILTATLSRGKLERATVRMIRRPSREAGAITEHAHDPPSGTAPAKNELSGRVLDQQGQPIEGAEVHIFNQDCFNIRTDREGRFRHLFDEAFFSERPGNSAAPRELLRPERLTLRFIKRGFAPTQLEMGVGEPEQTVHLGANTYFEGNVIDPQGAPAKKVRVRGLQSSPFRFLDQVESAEDVWTETWTDDLGHYKLLVQPGEYLIVAGNPGGPLAWLPKRAQPREGADQIPETTLQMQPERPLFTIRPNEVRLLDVALEAGIEFRARVIDSVTGMPAPNVEIFPRDYPEVLGKSDDAGLIVIRSLPAGSTGFWVSTNEYVRVWSDGSAPRWQEALRRQCPDAARVKRVSIHDGLQFDLEPGMPEATVLVEPPVTLAGRVLDPEGNPVSKAIVRLVRPTGIGSDSSTADHGDGTVTKQDGSFSIRVAPSDGQPQNLMVHDGFRMRSDPDDNSLREYEWRRWANGVGPLFETIAGERLDNIELRLTRPGSIRGRLVDKVGNPIARSPVYSVAVDMREAFIHYPLTRSDGSGRFEIRLIRPGRHQLYGGRPKHLPVATAVTAPAVDVRAGETTNVGDVTVVATDD
jgi:beta-lactamase regulating signal transducer with metallopeptidase domain/protocatechuate 3,4-dioxygenase beta subunit